MQTADLLIHTKLRMPLVRPRLVPRPRLYARIAEGLQGPVTLVIAPAGSGKTTLVGASLADCRMPVAWLSLDKDDNHEGRFLGYLVAALREADSAIGIEAFNLIAASQQAPAGAILTSLINDLDTISGGMVLVLDDYQFINSRFVHDAVGFLLEHCPGSFHLLIASRSDPPLPLARLRVRGHVLELRAADLRFLESEAAQFLNDVMGLQLDARSVAMLEERTEGWIAGLQMAALSMRDRDDKRGFVEGFSGSNRVILDYLLEEVLASQSPEIQRFLLRTSILERLTAPLCDAILADDEGSERDGDDRSARPDSVFLSRSASTLEHLERANVFLVPLDDERNWYRYHQLFSDLLRTQLQKSLGAQGVARLHLRAAEWYERNGSILEATHHASLASDDERVERLIEQHYMDVVNRGEMSWVRSWMGKLSKDQIYRRPWLCLFEALSRSWFGQLEEAGLLLDEAEERIRSEAAGPDAQSMRGYHAFVKSRVTAMQGDTRRAIEYGIMARQNIGADNLALQNDASITLGFEYFLYGDFVNAEKTLDEMIRSGIEAEAINNPVAGYALLARMRAYQGRLREAHDYLQKASQLVQEAEGKYLGVTGLGKIGMAALLCEWNDTEAALSLVKQGMDLLPYWGKADDLCLAYSTLSRIHRALGNLAEAASAIEKAAQIVQTCGLFSEARSAVEMGQVRTWMVQGDWPAIHRWLASVEKREVSHGALRYEDESTHILRARVLIAQDKLEEAVRWLSKLEESAQSAGREGRLIEMMNLHALSLERMGQSAQADVVLAKSLSLAQAGGFVRVFLDEGQPMHALLARWLAHAGAGPLRDYALHLLSHFEAEPHQLAPAQERASFACSLVEPLSQRELEVLHLMAMGRTNQEIARQIIVAPGTVKAHTASIYRKLDVANRTEAVARARQLGILT
jgi:LuxR family maltose regulon positive regulatory protein